MLEPSKPVFVFPGQGPHSVEMLSDERVQPEFNRLAKITEEFTGVDLLSAARSAEPEWINRNDVASLATVCYSLAALHQLGATGVKPIAVAGYSVGQWTAMYAGGMISLPGLMKTVKRRADEMSSRKAGRGTMLAVIGVATSKVSALCEEVTAAGDYVAVSNDNAVGQCTVAGTVNAIEKLEKKLMKCGAKKLVRLNVSGAWHSKLMEEASRNFRLFLESVEIKKSIIPVIDNVTGLELPRDQPVLLNQLAKHVDHPVRWLDGVKNLIESGAKTFIEVGWGNTLTKFGFFIDRNSTHIHWGTLQRNAE